MISLDQVQLLEKKVEAIFIKMNELRRENAELLNKNKDLAAKNDFLSQKISSFEADQNKIEMGIINALNKLNSIENNVVKANSVESSGDVVSGKTIAEPQNNVSEPQKEDSGIAISPETKKTEINSSNAVNDASSNQPEEKDDDYPFDFGMSFDETEGNSKNQELY